MDNQISTIVCPNCGANASNFLNCDYCGSLLVRFADKGIPIVDEKYGKKAKRFEGLEDALRKNLEEQARTNGENHVHTFIKNTGRIQKVVLDVTNPKSQAEQVIYKFHTNLEVLVKPQWIKEDNSTAQSLVICVRFYEFTKKTNDGWINEQIKFQKRIHDKFKELDIYSLFTLQEDFFFQKYNKSPLGKVYQYYLDFGQDAEGAASIITQYLINCREGLNKLEYELSSYNQEDNFIKKAFRWFK